MFSGVHSGSNAWRGIVGFARAVPAMLRSSAAARMHRPFARRASVFFLLLSHIWKCSPAVRSRRASSSRGSGFARRRENFTPHGATWLGDKLSQGLDTRNRWAPRTVRPPG